MKPYNGIANWNRKVKTRQGLLQAALKNTHILLHSRDPTNGPTCNTATWGAPISTHCGFGVGWNSSGLEYLGLLGTRVIYLLRYFVVSHHMKHKHCKALCKTQNANKLKLWTCRVNEPLHHIHKHMLNFHHTRRDASRYWTLRNLQHMLNLLPKSPHDD